MNKVTLFISITFVIYLFCVESLKSDQNTRKYSSKSLKMLVEREDDRPVKRIVSPNELSSLFGPPITKKNEIVVNRKFMNDFDDEDDEDMHEISNNDEEENSVDADYEEAMKLKSEREATGLSRIQNELEFLENMNMSSDFSSQTIQDTEEISSDSFNFDYADLDKLLDKSTRVNVADALSMSSSSSTSTSRGRISLSRQSASAVSDTGATTSADPRIVKYDPKESMRGDPMKYGAYRRWKVVVEDAKNGKSKSTLKKKNKNGSAGNKNAAEKFYDAIKNLGSGPGSSGSRSSTGVADPPPNRSPIQPNKSPSPKKKKRVITSEEINGLFANSNQRDPKTGKIKLDEYNDQEEEDQEKDEEEEMDDKATTGQRSVVAMFEPFGSSSSSQDSGAGEEMPKWLKDAEANRNALSKNKKNKKQKSLTDDWRFWLGLISTAGFVSAAYSIYHQTGGFGSGLNPGSGGPDLII